MVLLTREQRVQPCDICGDDLGNLRTTIYVCGYCWDSRQRFFVSLDKILDSTEMTHEHLGKLNYVIGNRILPKRRKRVFFLRSHVAEAFKEHFKDLEVPEFLKIKEKKDKIWNLTEEEEARKKELMEYMEERRAEFRRDSKVCIRYIKGSTEYTKEEIAEILIEMRFFFDQTNYVALLGNTRERDTIYNHGFMENEDEIRFEAKYRALKEYVKVNIDNPNILDGVPETLRETVEDYMEYFDRFYW